MESNIKLHDYQIECIEKIREIFEVKDKQIVQLPTGSGKTFIFLNFLKKYAKSALIICPSIELQEQIQEWGDFFLGKRNISKGIDELKPYNVLTLASLNYPKTIERIKYHNFEYVILDEAHHGCSNTFINFLENFKEKNFKLLGLTASPERLDKKNLLDIFENLSFSMNILDMIEKKQLCDVEALKINTKVHLRFTGSGKEFSKIDLKSLDIDQRNSVIIETFETYCCDKKTLIFCIDVEHSRKIAASLKERGHLAHHIHGKMSFKERKEILQNFKSGKIKVLANCQLLTEGFDEPSIEALLLTRPTRSKSLYCQMVGRGLRNYPGKEYCYLYELADNNHKICTFNVLGGLSPDIGYSYPNGMRLSNFRKEIQSINFEKLLLEIAPFEIFNLQKASEDFINQNCFHFLGEKLISIGVPSEFVENTTILEAEFLLWKEKLKVKYGKF